MPGEAKKSREKKIYGYLLITIRLPLQKKKIRYFFLREWKHKKLFWMQVWDVISDGDCTLVIYYLPESPLDLNKKIVREKLLVCVSLFFIVFSLHVSSNTF